MNRQSKRILSCLLACFVAGLTIALSPAHGAERIITYVGPYEASIAIDDLQAFATDGSVRGGVKLLASRLGDEARKTQIRQGLQHLIKLDPVLLSRITYTPMVEEVLQRVGRAIQTQSGLNGFHALRSALILAAAHHPQGWTALDVMRSFASPDIRLNLPFILQISQDFKVQSRYRDAAVKAIAQQAVQEAATQPSIALTQLPDLRQTGTMSVIKRELTFDIQAPRPTPIGLANAYRMPVDFYLPENATQPAPLIVISHGFGGERSDNAYLAEHLASHGFAVATPEHIGSDLHYRTVYLQGALRDLLSPIEYVSRPLDITHMLDRLEDMTASDPDWQGRIDLNQVGVMGNSFGGTTALSIAGAELNLARLQQGCTASRNLISPAFILQCQAQGLSTTDAKTNLRDPRIKAVVAAYPLTSLLFGPEEMREIEVPALLLSGSQDFMAPAIEEQIHPFVWLNAPQKHLALMISGTHFSSSSVENYAKVPAVIRGPDAAIGRAYLKALSTAFFQQYLTQSSGQSPYLTESYAKAVSQAALKLHLIHSLTPEQLIQAYGKMPPIPIIPTPIVAPAI